MVSDLPAFGIPLMYLTVLTNCLHDFLVGIPEPLAHPSCRSLQIRSTLRHVEDRPHS